MRALSFPRWLLLSLACMIACESSTAPNGESAPAAVVAMASLNFIPNAPDVGISRLPKTLPRAIDPVQCAFYLPTQEFLCTPYSIPISQVFTGYSDTLSYELLDAYGSRMSAYDAARTTAIRTHAAVEYVTQFQGTQLPGDLHQTLTARLRDDGAYVIDGSQTVHSSSVAYRGPINYKTDTMSVTVSGVTIPRTGSGNGYPTSGTVIFVMRSVLTSTVTFNGTQFASVALSTHPAGQLCKLDLANVSSTALSCGQDGGLPIVASMLPPRAPAW